MHQNSRHLRIEWGDCDPAGIVFYPRYFAMFDHSTHLLIETASGLSKYEMLQAYDDFIGLSDGRYPRALHDPVPLRRRGHDPIDLRAESADRALKWSTSCSRTGELCLEGFETRVWVGRDPQDASKIKSKPIPDDLVAKFKAGS